MKLSEKNRELILALQEDPLASYVKLSKKMNITPATAKSRLKQLWAQDRNEQIVIGVAGNLDPHKINLSTTTFLLDMELDQNNLRKISDLCESHPYTFYQNRIFGSFTGFLVQFNAPIGSEDLLSDFFMDVKADVGISKIDKFNNPDLTINSYPDVSILMKPNWEFDFFEWFEHTSSEDNSSKKKYSLIKENNETEHQNRIELGHIIVTRELMINGRRKQSEIMLDIRKNDHYNDFERQLFHDTNQREVSRYFDFVNQFHIISNYQLLFNRNKFGLYHQYCFTGELRNGYKQKFTNLLEDQQIKIPFRMGMNFKKNKYFIYLETGPTQSNQAMDFLQSISKEMNTMILDGSFKYQLDYPIWHRNYISSDKGWHWNASKKWMVDLPISNAFN